MTAHDYWVLSPALAMAGLAIIVVLADLAMPTDGEGEVGRRAQLSLLSVAGLVLPAVFALNLWFGWFGEAGDGPAFHGAVVADRFALFFQFILIGVTAGVVTASAGYSRRLPGLSGEFLALVLFSVTGMMLLVSARELITIYVSLELTALPVAALAAFSRDGRSSEAGLKFLVLSGVSSAVLLYGMVYLYGYTGSTDVAVIAERIGALSQDAGKPFGSYAALLAIILIVAGFGFKMAVVPWQMWVPDVYEGSPTPVAAFLSVASKASAFAVVLRVLYTSFGDAAMTQDWSGLFAIAAAFTMTAGNLLALSQKNVKRLLGYSTIAHAGYMLMGVAAVAANTASGTGIAGPQGVLYYLGGYAFTNLAVFFAVIAITNRTGSELIAGLSGLGSRSPAMAGLLAVGILSLLGIPPTVGFMSKVFVFSAAVNSGLAWLAILGVLNTVISAYYYLGIVRAMYFEEPADQTPVPPDRPAVLAATIAAAGVAVFGLGPWLLLTLAEKALSILPA
jgi:NADH-quinone oxidoreductase subunit N